jgi:hypothetical protein
VRPALSRSCVYVRTWLYVCGLVFVRMHTRNDAISTTLSLSGHRHHVPALTHARHPGYWPWGNSGPPQALSAPTPLCQPQQPLQALPDAPTPAPAATGPAAGSAPRVCDSLPGEILSPVLFFCFCNSFSLGSALSHHKIPTKRYDFILHTHIPLPHTHSYPALCISPRRSRCRLRRPLSHLRRPPPPPCPLPLRRPPPPPPPPAAPDPG